MCVWEQNKKIWSSIIQCVLILIDIWIGGSVHQLFVNRLDVSQKFRRDFRPSWRQWWWDLWWSWFYHETFLWHSEAWSLCLTVIPCDCSREQFSKSEVFVCVVKQGEIEGGRKLFWLWKFYIYLPSQHWQKQLFSGSINFSTVTY